MAITGKLGLSDSQLGNIELGGGPPSLGPQVYVKDISETLTFSQTLLYETSIIANISESLTLSQILISGRSQAKNISESLTLSEVIVRGASKVKNVNEFLTITEYTDGAINAIFANISETLTFTETTIRGLSRQKNISEALTIVQTPVGQIPKITNTLITNHITFFETVFNNTHHTRDISETLTLVEEAKVRLPMVIDLAISETLILSQALPKKKSATKNVSETLAFVETKIPGLRRNYTINENLFLVERASGIVAKITANSESLVFTETLVFQRVRIRNIHETLNLTENLTKANIYVRNISEVLPLQNGMYLPIKVGGVIIYVAPVQVIKVPKKCFVMLDCAETSTAITLPCPQMGDSEKNLNQQVIKRSMTNVLYTYIRKNDLQELKYTFLLGRPLCQALENFCYTNIDKVLTLTNWKGEIWKVYISNNPLEFDSKGLFEGEGESWEISLEFQGIKILG